MATLSDVTYPAFLAALMKCSSGACGLWNIAQAGGPGNSSYEGGIDVPSAAGTPVYALAAGQLRGSGYFDKSRGLFNLSSDAGNGCSYCHGVVTIRCQVPGYGLQDMYYQHITIDPGIKLYPNGTTSGPSIAKGQLLGTINSDPGEVEIGFNATGWGTIWGPDPHPAPWNNAPWDLIRALINADPSFAWGSQTQGSSGLTGGTSGAIGNVLQHINNAISPNEDVANLLEQWDVALGIVNPFNVPMQTDIVVQVPKVGPFGGQTLDTGFPNPGALSGYILQVAENIGYDFTALLVRGLFLAVGVGIFMAMGQSLAHQYGQQASDMLGGPEGIAQIAGAFA